MAEPKSITNYRLTDRARDEMVRRQITEEDVWRIDTFAGNYSANSTNDGHASLCQRFVDSLRRRRFVDGFPLDSYLLPKFQSAGQSPALPFPNRRSSQHISASGAYKSNLIEGRNAMRKFAMRRLLLLLGIFLSMTLTACALLKKNDNTSSHYKYNQELPLTTGNYWAYRVTRYDGFNPNDIMTATFIMTDTITNVEIKDGFFVATVQSEQSKEIPIEVRGNYPVSDTVRPATTTNYWLIVDGNRVIRQNDKLNLSDFSSGEVLVEYVFPMDSDSRWSMCYAKDAPINRKVTRVGAIAVPAGKFTDCRYLEGIIGGTTFEDWFCPGIGVVWHNAEHHGTPYGNRRELVSYRVK